MLTPFGEKEEEPSLYDTNPSTPNPASKPKMAFRMASDQQPFTLNTPGQETIWQNMKNLGLAQTIPEEKQYKTLLLQDNLDLENLKPVPMPSPPDRPDIDPGMNVKIGGNSSGSHTISPDISFETQMEMDKPFYLEEDKPGHIQKNDDLADFVTNLETKFKQAKEETARKIAWHTQNGWPDYSAGNTDTIASEKTNPASDANEVSNIVSSGINALHPQNTDLGQLGNPSYQEKDILVAKAKTDTGIMSDTSSGLIDYGVKTGQTLMDSDHGIGSIDGIHGKEKQDKATEPAESEQKKKPSVRIPTDRFSGKINGILGGTQIDMSAFILEGSKSNGVIPGDTSGLTLAEGWDLSRHKLSDFKNRFSPETGKILEEKYKDFFAKENGRLGPTGAAADALYKKQGLGKFKLTEGQMDEINQVVISDKISKGIASYEKSREKHPDAIPFRELPSEVQTVIALRYHQRQNNWTKGPGPDPKNLPETEFYKTLMKGGNDPVKFKSDLAQALKIDRNQTGSHILKGRYSDEAMYLGNMAAFEKKYEKKLKEFDAKHR